MRIVSAIAFSPRGGSAHVARALAEGLSEREHELTLVSGSRSDLEGAGDAAHFYRALDVRPLDFTAALGSEDPLRYAGGPGEGPMHPSYEDRSGAPDHVFAALSDEEFEIQVEAWARALDDAGADEADVLHLHHLTPINEAAARVAPGVPRITHLHGTELLMLEAITSGEADWEHSGEWERRLRAWAADCERLLVAPSGLDRAASLLELPAGRFVALGNGFDPARFHPQPVDRAAHWRRLLVDEPRGWAPGAGPGSVAYEPSEVEVLEDGVVIVYVGRFTAVKRVPLLIEAFASAHAELDVPAGLVLLGGHPGEWEGEHPLETVERTGARDVFLAGWHDHDSLPGSLNAADVIALASVREQFGQVLVEGMACGLPAIAVERGGPAAIVEHGVSGCLVPPDDVDAMRAAIVEITSDAELRAERSKHACEIAQAGYSWPAIVETLEGVLADATSLTLSR